MPVFALVLNWEEFGQLFVEALAFGLLGIALLALGFKVFERITPKLDVEEQLKAGNMAVGVMVAAVLLAIGIIVAVCVG
jgi:putative membrane protein